MAARNFQIIQNPWLDWNFHHCCKIFCQTICPVQKKWLCEIYPNFFSGKILLVYLSQKNQIAIKPLIIEEQFFHVFSQISRALDHVRVQFTLVSRFVA